VVDRSIFAHLDVAPRVTTAGSPGPLASDADNLGSQDP
jgi:hypothetical protein